MTENVKFLQYVRQSTWTFEFPPRRKISEKARAGFPLIVNIIYIYSDTRFIGPIKATIIVTTIDTINRHFVYSQVCVQGPKLWSLLI